MTVAPIGGTYGKITTTFLPFSALANKSAVRMRSSHGLPFPHRRQGWQSSINGDLMYAAAKSRLPEVPRPPVRPARVPRWCSSCWPRPSTESARFSSWSSTKAFSPATGKGSKFRIICHFWQLDCAGARMAARGTWTQYKQ